MDTQYHPVNRIDDSRSWMPFLKQLHMCSGPWVVFFMNGLCSGAPTVFVPQIRRDWNATSTVDDELASWLYSTSYFAALPWIFFLPPLTRCVGRKIPYLACGIAMTAVYIILYFSSAPYQILIAEAIQGFVSASCTCAIVHIIPEYCNHRYRSMYLNIQCTSFYWGMWVSNAIGTFVSWKYIPIAGLICSLYSLSLAFYPESPRWLASKAKFAECQAAHRWLRGSSPEAEKELQDLIKSQMDYLEEDNKMTCSRFATTLTLRAFYMPLFIVVLVSGLYNLSGKFVCSIYAIEILKRLSDDENTVYTGMLIMDGVTVLGMYVGSFVSKIIRMRLLFFTLSFLSIAIMYSFSLYLYLQKRGVVQENNIVTLVFLVMYSLTISSGPITLCLTIYSEIISPRYQTISYVIGCFIFMGSCTAMLKSSPVIFNGLGLHGSFLFYAIGSSIVVILLYIYLPETKGKTLMEIEEHFKDPKKKPEAETLTKVIRVAKN